MHVCYLLSWFPGVAQTWRDEILTSIGMLQVGNAARAVASSMRPKQHFDFRGFLLVNG